MTGDRDASTWHRAQLSRAWQVAQVVIEAFAAAPWADTKPAALCDGGLGSPATRSALSAVAVVSGRWQVVHLLSSARWADTFGA